MSSTSAIRIGLIAFVASASGFAQMQNNMDKELTCQNENRNGRLARHCEIREQAVAKNADSPAGSTSTSGLVDR